MIFTYRQTLALFLVFLTVGITPSFALTLSNVQGEGVSSHTGVVNWQTDEPSDSFISYRTQGASEFETMGDSALVSEHQFILDGLESETTYEYYVESGGVTEDNDGNYYTFSTLAPDTTAPDITLDVPEVSASQSIDVRGETEAGARITLYVNDVASGEVVSSDGTFVFLSVVLLANQDNTIRVEAEDLEGNVGSAQAIVRSDVRRPEFALPDYSEQLFEGSMQLSLSVTESVTYEIFVNNVSQATGEGEQIEATLRLSEGENVVRVLATDTSGQFTEKEFSVVSDTLAPTVSFEIARGQEFYEGRARSNIVGESEPGARAYLYVYRPLGYEYNPNFERATARTTVEEDGSFRFSDVNFEASDLSLDEIAPREVPSDLLNYAVPALDELESERLDKVYHVFVVAEDRAGRTAYSSQTITVNSCFSGNFDFVVESLPEFQRPLTLNPTLLDDGREHIEAAFRLNYNGRGVESEGEEAYEIENVRFSKACTPGMLEDEFFATSCAIFPPTESVNYESPDGSSVYVSWDLASTEDFSNRKDDFWNELKDRELVFPLQITLTYDERQLDGSYERKVQTSCYDLGYQVDVPADVADKIPDYLADETVDALDWTLEQIATVKPILEEAVIIAWFASITSFFARTLARVFRIFQSNFEHYRTWVKVTETDRDDYACPNPSAQQSLYLEKTIDNWEEMVESGRSLNTLSLPSPVSDYLLGVDGKTKESVMLESYCPGTARMWKLEATLDQAYRWTWDRAGCRAVPARWTSTKTRDQIADVVLRQQQCAVTGRGVPLREVENCQERIEANPLQADYTYVRTDVASTCFEHEDQLYVPTGTIKTSQGGDVFTLDRVGTLVNIPDPLVEQELHVFQPSGSDQFMVARGQTCNQVCRQGRGGEYTADRGKGDANGCYIERVVDGNVQLFARDPASGQYTEPIREGRYEAGYTSDCFVREEVIRGEDLPADETGLNRCVCEGEEVEIPLVRSSDNLVREAVHEVDGVDEKWSYRQAQIYRDSGARRGTLYPEERYYAGRDFSAAFGANYLLDYARSEPRVAEIDPHGQVISSVQTVCLSATLKHVQFLEWILQGMRNCLEEAKTTGLQDAGMCKAIFTQHVCGLFYQAIAAAQNQCHPYNLESQGTSGAFGDFGALVNSGRFAIRDSLDSSVSDLHDDYGNAVLTEYFEGGSQGFAQSICLGALTGEWPMFSREALLDAAYAVPTTTHLVLAPRRREFTTYNPQTQSATYNYHVGGALFPGCRVRNVEVALKCVGNEDLWHTQVDPTCNGEGCDCLQAEDADQYGRQRTHVLWQGGNLASGQPIDFPIEVPEQVSSPYRYDHVRVAVTLDPAERNNVEQCFPDGFITDGLTGVFYEPIRDTSPPGELGCHVNAVTGEYECPEFNELFGLSGAWLEPPYVTCLDKETSQFVSCDRANLFTFGDQIITQVHVQTDGGGQCLRRSVRDNIAGLEQDAVIALPAGVSGTRTIPDSLGFVSETFFGGANSQIVVEPSSDAACSERLSLPGASPRSVSGGTYTLSYRDAGSGLIGIQLGDGISVSGDYQLDASRVLTKADGTTSFTQSELNDVVFIVDGFRVSNVLASYTNGESGSCVYRTFNDDRTVQGGNVRTLSVSYALYEPDASGLCNQAADVAVESDQGDTSHTARIRVQRELTELQEQGGLHDSFENANYFQVHNLAEQILLQGRGDMASLLAVYYTTAAYVAESEGDLTTQRVGIQNGLDLFFERRLGSQQVAAFETDVVNHDEYGKVETYMCEIAQQFSGVVVYDVPEVCGGSSSLATSSQVSSGTSNAPIASATPTGNAGGTSLDVSFANSCLNSNYQAYPALNSFYFVDSPNLEKDLGSLDPSGIVYVPGSGYFMVDNIGGNVVLYDRSYNEQTRLNIGGDLEGITYKPGSSLLYVAVEDDRVIKELEYTGGSLRLTGNEWDVSSYFSGSSNRRIEALTYVPSVSGGVFYVGDESNGVINVFSLSGQNSVTFVGEIDPPQGVSDDSTGLYYEPSSGLVHALYQDALIAVLDPATEDFLALFQVPSGTGIQEGITFGEQCSLHLADDEGHMRRFDR